MSFQMNVATLTLFKTLVFSHAAFAQEPVLVLQSGKEKRQFTSTELLKHPQLEKLKVEKDPAYGGKAMTYQAVPVSVLFAGLAISEDAVIQFNCTDGFSAPISRGRLLNEATHSSRAYIAVEDPQKKWPVLAEGRPSPGPFYLVWKKPDLSKVSPEEWPFMLAGFEVKGSLKSIYPKIFPSSKLSPDSVEMKGFRVFAQNCFACHTLNKAGTSQMGPDLNIPLSPVEYLQPEAFKILIRNPQNMRHWPQSRMNGFTKEIISDQDLENLRQYFKHMAERR